MGWGAVAVLIAVTGLSLFYRSCLGVIAPELTRDLGLTPELLRAIACAWLAEGAAGRALAWRL